MDPVPHAAPDAVPCPKCEYDLRGQASARCPECGLEFESIEAMIQTSQSVRRLLHRFTVWHRRQAIFTIGTIVITIGGIIWGVLGGRTPRIAVWALIALIPSSGLSAFVLLVQVLRWRRSALIPQCHRFVLDSSIPLLVIMTWPLMVAIYALIVLTL